jgi:hypothetical protein
MMGSYSPPGYAMIAMQETFIESPKYIYIEETRSTGTKASLMTVVQRKSLDIEIPVTSK